jgi:two-component system response regulator PilR (NtrC family)
VRGSFTGAIRDKRGMMQDADGGTLFLDEIGELSTNTQVKLLRALQEKRIRAVGDNREVGVDVRVIAATNQDLTEQIKLGRFREDFFYRINVISIHVPPLRERPEDLTALARFFVDKACARLGVQPKQLHRDTLSVLASYPWPGNVRELENVMERSVAMENSTLLTLSSLPPSILGAENKASTPASETSLPESGLDIETHLDGIRRELMKQALEKCGGVQKEAAKLLRMTYRAFRYHAEKFKLIVED